ncbi:hypothetical protein HPB50_008182 [Hyalomma asiaticum]|uniref:Uncharacterized protein n=1 Tax=Hyalomma asiaticum TaxID=266040 RepID=A0ACB7SP64_HYAAI|nr:hypothetical protein HPB50_008182 [Hyalomma asiaticum]
MPSIEVPDKNHDLVSEVKSPYAYSTFMFTDTLVDHLTIQTNLYSTQEQGKSIATNAEEIRRFLGILTLMGVYKSALLEDNWSLDGRFPPVADVMPLKRFQALRRYVHFANNLDNGIDSDRLSKVLPLFENLREQFLKIPAERKHSIDEVVVAYKGTRAGNLRENLMIALMPLEVALPGSKAVTSSYPREDQVTSNMTEYVYMAGTRNVYNSGLLLRAKPSVFRPLVSIMLKPPATSCELITPTAL